MYMNVRQQRLTAGHSLSTRYEQHEQFTLYSYVSTLQYELAGHLSEYIVESDWSAKFESNVTFVRSSSRAHTVQAKGGSSSERLN